MIGSEEADLNIVKTAQSLGVYVIAVDGKEKSPTTVAKNVANESWDIDYFETEKICSKCLEKGIDGVIAGYSEFRVLAACRIANKLGKPFYATEEQIRLTWSKRQFKDQCIQYGIPVPRDFCYLTIPSDKELREIKYPVIVKPTDYAGRKGITICNNYDEAKKAIKYALKFSKSGILIIEEYIEGTEFAAIYTISNGEISLSCFNEKYLENSQVRKTGLCDLALVPAKKLNQYLKTTNDSVKAFLRGIGAKNGVAFFQGIGTDDCFYIFEMGYRLNGGNDYFLIEQSNGISYMKMLISHSLTGEMGDDLSKDNPHFQKYYINYIMYAHAGVVKVSQYYGDYCKKGIDEVHIYKMPGSEIHEDGSTAQKAFSFKISADTMEELTDLIHYVQDHVKMEDLDGNSLLFEPFDTKRLGNE